MLQLFDFKNRDKNNFERNFFKPKWVKLGTLLKIPETKLKIQSLVTARGHKENPNKKQPGCLP